MGKTCKYYKQQRQISYDGGQTWQDLDEFQKGDLIERQSLDCSYLPMERWVTTGYTCNGADKYAIQQKEISTDGGRTWQRVEEYQQVLVEKDSDECQTPPPEPTGCDQFIVDGGHWSADVTGGTSCDSAFLFNDGVAIFEPATASTWVTINKYHWDEDPASTMCTDYSYYPCVANNLMYLAGLVSSPVDCADSPSLDILPAIVRKAVRKENEYAHALGTITYTLPANTGTQRSCTIKWYVDNVECTSREFTITQEAQDAPTCDCSTFRISNSGTPVPASITTLEYSVGRYTGASGCESEIYCSGIWSGSDFLSNFRFSGGIIYAKIKAANTSTSTRRGQYKIKQGDCEGYVNVSQSPAPVPVDDKFEWNIAGHETHYDANVSANATSLQLEQFTSRKNGVELNGVMSSPASWIITNNSAYINMNELAPNITNTLYLNANTTSASRTGTLTLTQKGTSNTITLFITQAAYTPDCTITKFTVDSEVCRGSDISYSFDVKDTLCRTTQYFAMQDSAHNVISFNATPNNGKGSGTIPTTGCATGNATISVPINGQVVTYTVNIKDCATPVEPIDVDIQIINTLDEDMYFDYIDFYSTPTSTPLKLSTGQDVIMKKATKILHKQLSYTLETYTFVQVKMRDTFAMHRTLTCTCDSTRFVDGGTIKINIIGIE